VNVLPLGAGALAGSTLPIKPGIVADRLEFDDIATNSIDAVSDRDYIIEFCSIAAIIMMHLSRLAEELVLWAGSEFGFVTLADDVATGSSLMPHKKNPDIPELIRGKTGRVYGNLMRVLTMMKGLPLAYCRDMQEDKEGLFDSVNGLLGCLTAMSRFLEGTTFNVDHLREAAEDPMLLATDVAEYLVQRGVPFRESHEMVGKAIQQALDDGRTLRDLTLEEWKTICPKIESDIKQVLDLEHSIEAHASLGAGSRRQIREQIREYRERLAQEDE
jgi:argininosuccinate lyase